MSPHSLRLRLVVAWVVFIALVLQIAGIGLRLLFERSITSRTETELEADLRQLKRGMEVAGDGKINIVREPTDPQFDIVFGGRYWQITEAGHVLVRSPSLDDFTLTLPVGLVPTAEGDRTWLRGPESQRLYAVVRAHDIGAGKAEATRTLTIVTAVDAAEITSDTDKFSRDLFHSLGVLALILTGGAWLHVTIGLRPLERLRSSLAEVRNGRSRRLDGEFPDEVQPLVAETNALLEAQEAALRTARERAGDLAHGLKTPLAIMASKSRQLRRQGEAGAADEIDRQIDAMRRHVDRELALARARGAARVSNVRVDARQHFGALLRAVQSLPRGRELQWIIDLDSALSIAADPDDLNNILGNLVDNAMKWAASRIRVAASRKDGGIELVVEDDGAGVPCAEIARIMKRGERADVSVAGSGLGLAIVNDLVALYHGKLSLEQSTWGGLRARVFIPERTEA